MTNCITDFLKRLFCKGCKEEIPKRIFIINTGGIIDQLHRDNIVKKLKESMRKVPQPAGPIYPEPPKPPPSRLMREGDVGPYCPKCGSSLAWKHPSSAVRSMFIESRFCIQSECDNYWGKGKK